MALTVETDGYGVPLGNVRIAGGPGRYEFLIEGLHIRGGGDSAGSLMFKLEHEGGMVLPVSIRITGVRQLPVWQCAPYPTPVGESGQNHDHLWEDAWEFQGYCPGHGVPVRGIYSPVSRKGIAFLWQAHVDDYGCAGARRDLLRFFSDGDTRTALFALERAKGHMFRGSLFGELHVDCLPCLGLFRELRKSCELP